MPGFVAAEAEAGKEKVATNSNINAIAENLFIMDIIAHFSSFRNLSPASEQKMEGARGRKFFAREPSEAPPPACSEQSQAKYSFP